MTPSTRNGAARQSRPHRPYQQSPDPAFEPLPVGLVHSRGDTRQGYCRARIAFRPDLQTILPVSP